MKWPVVKLSDVAPACPLKSTTMSSNKKVLQITLDHIESNTGFLLQKNYQFIDNAGTSTHWFDEHHVLYSKLRPYLNKVYLPDEAGICTTELVPMLPDSKYLDRKYLSYYLRSKKFVNWISCQTVGAKMPRVSMKVFWEHQIPLPPLPEQKRIAAILDKADAIRRKRQQAIQLADEFLRAVFLDMFGDPVTNPKGWEVKKFSSVGSLDRGKSKHRPRNDPILLGGEHPLIQTGDVANSNGYIKTYNATYSDIGLAQSKKWDSGVLCITIAANIAKTGILTFPACFPDSVVGFIPNTKQVTVEYVQYWLSFLQQTLEKNAPESAQKNINLEILRALDIPTPSLNIQKQFSKVVAVKNKLIENTELSVNHSGHLFNALSQRAFSGNL